MSPFRRPAAALACALVLLFRPCGALASAPDRTGGPPTGSYDAIVGSAFSASEPGAAVIVVKDGQVVYRKAVGLASVELGVPLQPDMVFRLASITKQFTAAAIMLLVEQGKLALSDPIEKFFPDYPTQGHAITVEHLLTHTSGIRSYTDIPGWMTGRIKTDMKVAELVDAFKNEPMQFAPGTRYSYNNSAYVLLGAIVEKVSGQAYGAFVTEHVFKPLGMTSSFYGSNEPVIPKRVQGYTRDGDAVRNAQYLSMTQPYSAGALLSSVDDLARWDAALSSGKLLTRASLERMWTPYVLANGKSTGYGYGWSVGKLRGRPVVNHGGGIPGFSTFALRLGEDGVFVAVLCNSDSPKSSPSTVARRLAAVAIGKPFPERVATGVDPRVLAGYAGVYGIDKESSRTVTVENGKLYTQRSGGRKLEAKASSETEFFYDDSLTYFTFERDASGRAVAMQMYPDGGDEPERAVRTADAPSGPEVAKVDPATYEAYVGQFELQPGFVLTITREGDRLMTQATGQQKIEVFPLSATEFFPKVVEARIVFVKGADGKVDQLILKQGGRDMPAKRIR